MCDSPAAQSVFIPLRSDCTSNFLSSTVICGQFHHLDGSSSEVSNVVEGPISFGSRTKCNTSYPHKIQLEQDVQRLQQQLQEELEVHAIFKNAIEKKNSKLYCAPCLPLHARELLSTIAFLEVTISKLEQEIVSLNFQLSQERNERRLAEYRLRHTASRSISDAVKSTALFNEKVSMMDTDNVQAPEAKKLPKGMPPKGLWDNPNQLSEEMVRCMKNIFISLTDAAMPSKSTLESQSSPVSPCGNLSSSSWWSSSERSMISSRVQSPQVDVQSNSEVLALDKNAFDPYKVHGKLSWADIGNYGSATEVSWMSVGKKQLEYASGVLRRFRTLVEQLAKVNPIHLSCDEKLSFWINLYNALIMHAYLAYGVPRSDLKFFSLMQKAAYTVGGHSFSAAAIKYAILKMKPPLHRPQIVLLLALNKLKVSEEQRKCAIDTCEPLVAFSLSCGMYSSPALRVYTAKNVREELQEAQHDFIRASVGVNSKGKLLVPKMLHCFAKGMVDDSDLGVWISHYLPPNQAAFIEQCISQRRQSLLGSRNYGILPFDSRFRYLFLPDRMSLQ